jgi:hypothetical protein
MVWFELATLTRLFVDAPVGLGDIYLNVAVALSSIDIVRSHEDPHELPNQAIPFLWADQTQFSNIENIYWITTNKSERRVGNTISNLESTIFSYVKNNMGNKQFVSSFDFADPLDYWTRSAIIDRLK